jgi:hypothetical protein
MVKQDQSTDFRTDTRNHFRLIEALRRCSGAIREELRVAATERLAVRQVDHEGQHRAPIETAVVHAILMDIELLMGAVATEAQSFVHTLEPPPLQPEIVLSLHDLRDEEA